MLLEAKLLTVADLARLLHKAKRTIEVDVTRRPEALPPRLKIPGSRKVLWLESDVHRWLDSLRDRRLDTK
jgi:predicted DNA-binding transcriptional regulator AlpA